MSNIRTIFSQSQDPLLPGPSAVSAGTQSLLNRFVPGFKKDSLIIYLSTIQLAIYLLETVFGLYMNFSFAHFFSIPFCTLYDFGAKFAPGIVNSFEIHRLILPIFLHGSMFHLVLNVFSQIQIWFFLVEILKHFDSEVTERNFFIFYLACGIVGNVFSCIFNPYTISEGASGSIYGLLGFVLVFLAYNWRTMDTSRRNMLAINLFVVFFFNFGFSFQSKTIDMSAHMGGFCFGTASGLILIAHAKEELTLSNIKSDKFLCSSVIASILLSFVLTAYLFLRPINNMKLNC